MPTISLGDPKLLRAIQSCVQTLRRLANFEAALDQRLQELGWCSGQYTRSPRHRLSTQINTQISR